MQTEENRQELIERYLDGRMTSEEAVAFEANMKEDEVLSKAVSAEQMMREAMQRARARDLRLKTAKWRQNLPDPPPAPTTPVPKGPGYRLYFWLIALVCCLLLFAVYRQCTRSPEGGLSNPPDEKQNEPIRDTTGNNAGEQQGRQFTPPEKPAELKSKPQAGNGTSKNTYSARHIAAMRNVAHSAAGYVRIQPSVIKNAASPDTAVTVISKAKAADALKNNKWEAALRWLRQADSTDINVRQMKAHALFGAQRYDEAAEVFRTLAGSRLYGPDARKNIVICYLAQFPERQEAYRRELELLITSGSPALRLWAESLEAELNKLPD